MRTNTMARMLAATLLLARAGAAPASAQSFAGELPRVVQQGSIDANVMVLFDNSGSMNEAMYHPDYDPEVTWPGAFVENNTYYINSDGNYGPRNVPGRPSGANTYTPTAPLIRSYNQQGRYRGNYLNWIFYTATDEQRATLPQLARIEVAHMVMADIIQRSERVRFGLTKFNNDNFGTVVAQCGADKTTLVNTVTTIQGDAWTPLGESMETILNYFKSTGANAPIIADCQKSFCIVMTDGFPTKDRAVSGYLWDADGDGRDPGTCTSIGSPDPDSYDCSDHLDDVAYYMYHEDLRSDLDGQQNVVTYAIGFGVDASILNDTAVNGNGLYLMAEDAVDLWTSLELVMMDIISRISTGAAVAVVSTERGDEERLYRGKFMPNSWTGYLEAFDLPYENGDAPVWEAGHLLRQRAASSREIFTAIGTQRYDFTTGSASSLLGAMGLADVSAAADVIAWSRGDAVAGLRYRDGWKLGDVIHSTPVVVGAPANFSEDESYQAFMDAHADRVKMVYVGANDGMLHAVYAENGQEAWAFVPEFALPKLAAVADTVNCHTYTVDLTPTVRDCKLAGAWKTVLIGGGRQGGAGYFAIDVTYPTSPELLWQVALPNGKAYASESEIAVIGGKTVVLIGSGLDDTDGEAFLEVFAVDDGAHLGSLLLSRDSTERNKATAPTAVDRDLDGNYDCCYVGDLQGHLWKFEFDGEIDPSLWDRYELWRDTDFEITSRPTAAYGEGNAVYVYFGTGAYLEESDIATRDDNIFGCVFDRNDGSEHANLVDQTNSNHDLSGEDGWYIRLENAEGERVTEPAAVVAESVFFTSFVPSQEVCSAGGQSWLYRVSYRDGSVPDDGEEDEWDGGRSIALDEGVGSRPVVDIVNETVIVQSSDATITVQEIGQSYFHLTVRAWQENFDYVSGNN